MGGCSSQSLCLGHETNHCQPRLLPEPSDIHKPGRQTVLGNEHNGLKLSSDDLEKLTSAWTCRDIGSMTKQSDGESKEISKLEIVTDDISNIKHDSLHQFWLSVGRNCRCECGTGWSWQTVTGQEVTEIKEVTETVITEVIEVIEFPVTQRRSESKKTTMAGILLCHKQTVEDPGQASPPLASGPVDDDLESWINDIEDVTANQRPPSSELEVLKAQLQEQKLLRRLLEAHRPSVEAVTEGQQLGASENRAQAQDLPQRWQSLLQATADRHSQLEKILSQILQFQAVLDKLLNWLAVTERKIPISFPDTWENDDEIPLLEFQILAQEIHEHMDMVNEAVTRGEQLMSELPEVEARSIKEKLQSLRSRFTQLQANIEENGNGYWAGERTDLSYRDQKLVNIWLQRIEKDVSSLSCQSTVSLSGVCDLTEWDKLEKVLQEELCWVCGVEEMLKQVNVVPLTQEAVCDQLQNHKTIAVQITQHQHRMAELFTSFKKILGKCSQSRQETTQALLRTLCDQCEAVSLQNTGILLGLERASFLLTQFSETDTELRSCLQETQSWIAQLHPIVIDQQNLSQQQELSKLLEQVAVLSDSLQKVQDRVQKPSGFPSDSERIQEQIEENRSIFEELGRLRRALDNIIAQGKELLVNNQYPRTDARNGDIQEKFDHLEQFWTELQFQSQEQESGLLAKLCQAKQFETALTDLTVVLRTTEQRLQDLSTSSSNPTTLQHRLDIVQVICEEIETLQNDVKSLRSLGEGLTDSISSEDGREMVKHLDELDFLYRNVNKIGRKSHDQLIENLHEALQQQEAMKRLWDWLISAQAEICDDDTDGMEPKAVNERLSRVKELMSDLYLRKLEVETLTHHSQSFTRQLPVSERELIEGSLHNYREHWEKLERELVSKQHVLEKMLLGLGHFQPALQQILTWLTTTQELLDHQRYPSIDLHTCEIQLAKLRVLWNDVRAHEGTVQSVHQAGLALLNPNSGEKVQNLSHSLQELNQRWEHVKYQTEQQVLELERTVNQAQELNQEIQDLLLWIDEAEAQLSTNGLCEAAQTAQEKFQVHLELYKELEAKQCAYDSVYTKMGQFLSDCGDSKRPKTEHSFHTLRHKWNTVHLKMQERKARLSEQVILETQFHSNAQELIGWMGDTVNLLNKAPAPSLILESITKQLQEHQRVSSDVTLHHAQVSMLEQSSESLSSKQDHSLIQNVMATVREKWAQLSECTSQREQSLQEARKHAQQFSESRKMLRSWIDEMDQRLEAQKDIAVDNNDIKQQLTQHLELQKELRGRRADYEVTLRIGQVLMDKAEHPGDCELLLALVTDLSEHWNSLNGKSLQRQSMIEEVLLFSGRLTESLQMMLDWLYRAEVMLNEQAQVSGHLQSVKTFIENHKVFQKELGKRASCVRALKRAFRELNKNTGVNCVWLKAQMEELSKQWEQVCHVSVSKQSLLEAALCQAEHFQSLVQNFLGHLTQTERKLTAGLIPEEEQDLLEFKQRHQEAVDSLECECPALDSIITLGNEILTSCDPESVSIIQSCIDMVQTRWEEVKSWASYQADRAEAAMLSLRLEQQDLQHLQEWLEEAAESLNWKDQEPLPENTVQLEELLTQHSVLLDELRRKKTEIEGKKKLSSQNLDDQHQVFHQQRASTEPGHCLGSQLHLPLRADSSDAVSPLVAHLLGRWQQLWTRALDRQAQLQEKAQTVYELQALENFNFNTWRKRYVQWISSKKFRVLDIFRCIDKDQDGRISQQEFVQSVLDSKFPTSSLEMEAVAAIFDLNGDGFIDYYEFANALHRSRDHHRRTEDEERIEDEVCRQVAECNCAQRFQVEQISANRYRFGDSQQLRMVRILRSTVMVRVGGGWSPLDEFLVKNDPCRVKSRTNVKIKEKYLAPDSYRIGTVKSAGNQTRPHSQEGSPSRKNLSVASFNSAPNSPLPQKKIERSIKKE